MEIQEALVHVRDLMQGWGFPPDDWFLTGQYADFLSGYDVKVRKGHLNVVVARNKVPWDVRDALEVHPPPGTSWDTTYEAFVQETGFDFDLLLVTQERFQELRPHAVSFVVKESTVFLLDPLGELALLADTLELANDQGWGVAKGVRLLKFVEEFGGVLNKSGKDDMAQEFFVVAQKFQYLKTTPLPENKAGDMMKGLGVSKGMARGKVRIVVDPQELSFSKGEILVTRMTDPKYIPHLKKAAAVITDEGGYLCHAAISAREMNLPCIVAMGNATKLLKDGDMVEVDAEKGIVRKI